MKSHPVDLLGDPLPPQREAELPPISDVGGLQYIPDFISQETHDQLLTEIDRQPWLTELRRRVQHYGFRYDYKSRSVNYSMRIGELPEWARAVGAALVEQRLFPAMPDQVIVNEYQPGQGIKDHIDCEPCFTDTVASLSLGSRCIMVFTEKATKRVVPVLLEPRSLVVLTGPARYEWMHGIPPRKSDEVGRHSIKRARRVSLTFRQVIVQPERDA